MKLHFPLNLQSLSVDQANLQIGSFSNNLIQPEKLALKEAMASAVEDGYTLQFRFKDNALTCKEILAAIYPITKFNCYKIIPLSDLPGYLYLGSITNDIKGTFHHEILMV